jgi:hypothetical protein
VRCGTHLHRPSQHQLGCTQHAHAPSRSRRPPAGARTSSARAAAGRRSRACGPGSAAGRPPRPRSRAGSAGRTRTRPWMRDRVCGARAAPPALCIPAGRMVRGSPFVHGVTDRRWQPRGCGCAPSRRAPDALDDILSDGRGARAPVGEPRDRSARWFWPLSPFSSAAGSSAHHHMVVQRC